MTKVLIAGCGFLGSWLGRELVFGGREVWGLRRDWKSPEAQEALSSGIQAVRADLIEPRSLKGLPQAEAVVFCQAPSRERDFYRDVYYDGTLNLLEALKVRKPKRVVFISSTGVYGGTQGAWVDEESGIEGAGYETDDARKNALTLLEAERAVFSSGIPSIALRLGGIYGPGRNRVSALREGKIKPSFSSHYANRIHRDDAVAAILLLLEKGRPGEVYLGVDDEPVTDAQFYAWLCGRSGLPYDPPAGESAAFPYHKRCRNGKIKRLGLKLKYPTFREGYEELLKEHG